MTLFNDDKLILDLCGGTGSWSKPYKENGYNVQIVDFNEWGENNFDGEIDFHGVNVLEDDELRQGIKQYSDWPTIPQLYINQKFVGGCDIVKEMFETGELQTKLKE